ncbi:DsbE family thiol:disulfide interchange protein [Falsirhodobacter algicola]|uniref:DsbE family thiol:disulfide interchange protein n=1 Tax=Falsirhodobacter algicola TaxID=2692330 RepID=A0A8J8SKH2_9RHOB|nr:DsbE family thiol:disulfide interchange protein [Falsirhodobacter algicola]QUS35412.1 DsbE family thiol:disulfide interchange protein [Falsirhodobacter algicola]
MKPLLFVPPLIFAALGAVFLFGMLRDDPDALPTAFAGKPAPPITALPFDGAALPDDASLRDGTVTLVNFWASWCAPCRAEHPMLEALAADGVRIVGINYKDDPDQAKAFLAGLGDPFAAKAADPEGRMGLDWGIYGVPETFVVDGTGTIRARIAGPIGETAMREVIEPALR